MKRFYSRIKVIFILLLCTLNHSVFAQTPHKVNITFLPPGVISEASYTDVAYLVVDVIAGVGEVIKLYHDKNKQIEFTNEEYENSSIISGTGEDFGLGLPSGYSLFYKIVRGDLNYFLKKIIAIEMKLLEKQFFSAVIQSTQNSKSWDFNSTGYVYDNKYKVNLTLSLADGQVGGGFVSADYGDFIKLSNFSIQPADNNPFKSPISSLFYGYVKFFITFKEVATNDLLKYPSLNMNWNVLNSNISQIHKVKNGTFDQSFYTDAFQPHITMLVFAKNFLSGKEWVTGRFDFDSGHDNFFPFKPVVNIEENDYSLKLTWPSDPNAVSFLVSKSDQSGIDTSDSFVIQNLTSTEFLDEDVEPGKRYYYRIMPIEENGSKGNISDEVSGIPQAKLLVNLNEDGSELLEIGSKFTIQGNVSAINSTEPISNPSVEIILDELNYEFENVVGDAAGNFINHQVESPIIPGYYTYNVFAGGNELLQKKSLTKQVQDSHAGHDIAVTNIDIGDYLKYPTENISTTITLENYGDYPEQDTLLVELYNDSNTLLSSEVIDFSLAAGNNSNYAVSIQVPGSPVEDYYFIKASLLNDYDKNRLNNFQKATFFVSNLVASSSFRLEEGEFDNVIGQTRLIDGQNVTLNDVGTVFCEFSINGENTSFLGVDDYWFNDDEDFLLYIESIAYIDDTTFSVDIRGGGIHNNITYSPTHSAVKKLSSTTVQIDGLSSSSLDNNIEFILDIDALVFENWKDYCNNLDNNTLEIKFDIPSDASTRTHKSFIKIIDDGLNYWWIKRLYITPVKHHEIKINGSLQINNLSAGGNPDNIVGDRFNIIGQYENVGEFDEIVPIKLTVSNDSSDVWTLNDELTINKSQSSQFQLSFPTLGLPPDNYLLTVSVYEPEDLNQGNNIFSTNLNLIDNPPIASEFVPFDIFYEIGDSVNVKLRVNNQLGQTLVNANTLLNIETPDGKAFSKRFIYNQAQQYYECKFINNIGGNYYLSAQASLRRYKNGYANEIVKSKVQLSIAKSPGESKVSYHEDFFVKVSPVGNLYSFACDFLNSNNLIFHDAIEGNIINKFETLTTAFNYRSVGDRVILGITKLNTDDEYSNVYSESVLASLSFLVTNDQLINVDLTRVDLFDSKGNEMIVFKEGLTTAADYDTTTFKISSSDSSYQIGDTVYVTSSALGVSNLTGASYDLQYSKETLNYLSTDFDNSIGEYGAIPSAGEASKIVDGLLNVGISRLSNKKVGVSSPIVSFANSKFVVKDTGSISFSPQNILIQSPYQSITLPHYLELETTASTVDRDTPVPFFDSDTIYIDKDSTAIIQIKMNPIQNVYACFGEFSYDNLNVHPLELIEGNLLNSDSVETAFQYNIDSLQGRITFGITRLSSSGICIDTDSISTLLLLNVGKIGISDGTLQLDSLVFLDSYENQLNSDTKPQITVSSKFITCNTKIFLQGPFYSDSMITILNDIISTNQPYDISPWNYSGTESIDSIPSTDIVDWVLVELRRGTTSIVSQRAAFLKSDGTIVDLNGIDPVRFDGVADGNYYIVIYHRNHLPIMSATPVPLSSSSSLYDFTDSASKTYGGGCVELAPGVYGMYSGDANGNGQVQNNDSESYWSIQNGQSGYKSGDFNLNGQVQNNDRETYWVPNNGIGSQVPIATSNTLLGKPRKEKQQKINIDFK